MVGNTPLSKLDRRLGVAYIDRQRVAFGASRLQLRATVVAMPGWGVFVGGQPCRMKFAS
jgi:hypothetical protein